MVRPSILRFLALAASLAPMAGCQSFLNKDDAPDPQLARANALPPVASTQRLDKDGYPLLGAYPSSAAPQLSDAEVTGQERSLSTRVVPAAGAANTAAYDAKVAQARAVRARQAAEVDKALAGTSGTMTQPSDPAAVRQEIENGA